MIVTQAGRRRRKPAFRRRKNENRLGMSMAFLAIIMIIAVVGINSISLRQKQAKYIAREQELQQQIDAENARTEELKELECFSLLQVPVLPWLLLPSAWKLLPVKCCLR